MERSIFSLAYQGSIAEAITKAKTQKKLFVVYVSGNNAVSTRLEESTWMDPNVAESISKYCVLLQIQEGSTDAANFSAIYPQKPAPCITAIGYNGVELWQNEGFVNADILVSSLEKAWLSLHIQETTATFLATALASKKSEPHGTNTSTTSLEQGSSSSIVVPALSMNNQGQPFHATEVSSSEVENKASDHVNEEIDSELGDKVSSTTALGDVLEDFENKPTNSSIERSEESLNPIKVYQNSTAVAHMSSSAIDKGPVPKGKAVDCYSEVAIEASDVVANVAIEALDDKNANVVDDKIDSVVPTETFQVFTNEVMQSVEDKNSSTVEDDQTDVSESSLCQSDDAHLNIRLLDGASLQEKFLLTSTLRMIKAYVDENHKSPICPYDLAVPYPRKVFSDQDLNKTLSELGLHGRQTLIMVPRNQATGYHRGGSSSIHQINSATELDSSNGSNGGYFSFVRRSLSYINPLSYIGSGASLSNPRQESHDSMWQHSPNPTLQNTLRGSGTPNTLYSSNQSSSSASGRNSRSSSSSNRKSTSSHFGSNIHTLKHDEDDGQFTGRNAFWNGNSTEYGGDNDSK